MRKYLILFLAGVAGWALIGQAAQTPATTAAAPAISDQEALQHLDPAQTDDWNAAAKKITDGNDKIKQGNRDASAEPDPLSPVKPDMGPIHQKGAQELKEGRALLKDGTTAQDKLRKIAIANRDKSKVAAVATSSANLTVNAAQWPEAVHDLCGKLYASLGDLNYKRLYLADVYIFAEPKYEARPDLTTPLRAQFQSLDKDKKLLAPPHDWAFKLGQESNHLVISYPDRASLSSTKSAVILGELLYESRNGYATLSLRAVDLANMRIVANQVVELSVEPTLGKLLGLPSFRVPAKRNAPAAGDKPATALTLNALDPNDIFSSAKKTPYSFRLASTGRADTQENRFAFLLLKSYLLEKQAGVNVSDLDFLVLALAPEKPADLATVPTDVGGAWILPDVTDLSPSVDLNPLRQRVYSGNTDKVVGKVTIKRDLPKLTLPSPDDLRAGGYQ